MNTISKLELNTINRSKRDWMFTLLISLILFAVTVAVYVSAFNNDFVAWDDDEYVYQQQQVLNGISWDGFLWATKAEVAANWHPLTLFSLQIDAHFFGSGPYGFHRTSVLLHAINSVLVFLAIRSLTGNLVRSLVVAGLFSLHPMHVESVAWISERKDLLSGFFFCLTLLAYGHYVRSPSLARYLLIVIALELGLSSKSMLVTTPCVLLLLDYWPLARLKSLSRSELPQMMKLFIEKIPLLVLSAVNSMITIQYQKSAIKSLSRIPLWDRIENAAVSYLYYGFQTIWPTGLSPYYARHAITDFQVLVSVVVLISLTGLVIWQRTQRPYLLVGWLWFVGMLVPVIGIFQVGHHARADRYMYLSQIGLFLSAIWCFGDLLANTRRGKLISIGITTLILATCAHLTIRQIPAWHNSHSLWEQAYRLDSNNSLAVFHLAEFYLNDGNKPEAIRMTRKAIQNEDRSDCETLVMLGMLMADCGEYEDCVKALDKALAEHPDDADVLSNRAKALSAQGKWKEAADDYRRSTQISPGSAPYQFYLAHALGKIGRTEESRQIYASAVKRWPQWPLNVAGRAWWMSTSPNPGDRATFWPVCLAEQACEATGGSLPQFLDVLAAAYAESGRFEEAITTSKRAIVQAEEAKNFAYSKLLRERLRNYENHQPYRETPTQKNMQ